MLRPDGFTNTNVGNGNYPEGAEGGDVQWTLPCSDPSHRTQSPFECC